jgi:hypothetical protein
MSAVSSPGLPTLYELSMQHTQPSLQVILKEAGAPKQETAIVG